MIKIAIADDELVIAESIKTNVEKNLKSFRSFREKVVFSIFTDGKSILNQFKQNEFDLIFLDIDMPDISGIDIAKKMRLNEINSEIIFVSNKEDMVYNTIKYAPFRFIRKSQFTLEIREALEGFINKRASQTILTVFSTDNGKKAISIRKIIYIEVQSHKLTVHTNDKKGYFIANGNLKDMESELSQQGFIRIHNSYLVNFRYINLIKQKEVILDDGVSLPLSRGKYQSTKTAFMQFSREV